MTDKEQGSETDLTGNQEQDTHAEVWQEEMPPEDDFHDQPESTYSMSEEAESAQSPFEGQDANRKSGTKVMMGVLAVFALFIGGLAYWQFGGGSQPKGGMAVPLAVSSPNNGATEKKQATSSANSIEAAVTPTTAEADITSIYNAGLAKTTTPNTNTVAIPGGPELKTEANNSAVPGAKASEIITTNPTMPPETANAAVPSALMGPGAALQAPGKAAGNVGTTTASDGAVKPAASPQAHAMASAAIQSQVATGATVMAAGTKPAEMETRLKDLSSQIDELKKALQQTTEQTSQLAARLEASPNVTTIGNSGLESRLDQIEQQVTHLAQKKETKAPGKKVAKETSATEVVATVPFKDETGSHRAAKKATTHKAHKTRVAHGTESSKQKTGTWVLRAATPDSAWVSKEANSAELRQVQVGDILPGLGKVKAIRQTGEGWAVVGAKGTIR